MLSSKPDLVFNLVESVFGKSAFEMNIPAILELLNIPYTGSSPLAIALALDKAVTKKLLAFHDIRTPDFIVAHTPADVEDVQLHYPLFIKPLCEDGSIGISELSIVSGRDALSQSVQVLFDRFGGVLVEEFIGGREFNVSLLGNEQQEVLPVAEIDYSNMPKHVPNILSYNAKWVKESPEYMCSKPVCPAKVSDEVRSRLMKAAVDAYRCLELSGYGRVDFRMGSEEQLYVIDVNPNPCIAPDAGLAVAAKAAGISYGKLVEKIVRYGIEKATGVQKGERQCVAG
jgi:D-alanine-D-alanine ligase